MLAMQLPSVRAMGGLEIEVDGETWVADSPEIVARDDGSKLAFNAIGDDLIAAINNGTSMAIATDHDRYGFSLEGSAKTINLAQAVCRGEEKIYAPHLPVDQLRPAVADVPMGQGEALSVESSALSSGTEPSTQPSHVVLGEERITRGYALRARHKIEQSGANLVIVDSDGGLVDEAMALGAWIREQGLDTAVVHSCASACVEVFAAGRERLFATDAKVGIHQISIEDADLDSAEIGQYSVAQAADYFEHMGVDADLVIARSAVPAAQMKWLTAQEAMDWNLVTGVLSDEIEARVSAVASTRRWTDYEPSGTIGMVERYDPTAIVLLVLMFLGTGIAMVKINAQISR